MSTPAPARPKNVPLVLIIRDGWGENPNPEHDGFNAPKIASARGLTPVDDRLRRLWPKTLIKTSGEDVGLPDGTMGNSEVGHQNIGAGRVVPQESLVMTAACKAGLEHNAVIAAAIRHAAEGGTSLHLLGIASDAGVHGQLEHLYAILRACRVLGLSRVHLHLFTDGRDTGPFTGVGFVREVERNCREIGVGRIASVIGRYYAMDRDHRWERVQRAYDCLTGRAEAAAAASAEAAVQAYYSAPTGETLRGDEFVTPTAIGSADDVRASRIGSGDSVIFYNYRGDRPRELSAALVFPDDKWAGVKPSPDSGARGFDRGPKLDLHYVTMTAYWEELSPFVRVAFPKPPRMKNTAGEWFGSLGLAQLRVAETEKYPHVTFFFNDYRDEPWPGEERDNPQSPRVATYDLKPDMAAAEVCKAVVDRLLAPSCVPFIVVNFANGDMVGHTGNLEAAVQACAAVDRCVGEIVNVTIARGGSLIVTADHGNCEQMFDPATGSPHTAHTTYDVPLFVVGESFRRRALRGDFDASGWFRPEVRAARGRLADIVPTALAMMGLPQPPEMTGRSLLA
ncbi:MAG: 2,3-bisphosphoglycerate-independent phosphoglycerate mutase [Phycisphaeraceae bacterium]|nr:2,3-bisphosphoglycerate-independent phosphoglycerate mutase [Phycisphaeraceae bacterium]